MVENSPKVSIIIPTYNRAHLLVRAIRSVLNQTFQDFELIVVDDASIDNTQEIVKAFGEGRIKYIKHKENKGGSAARNTGIKLSKGIYIAFLDDDDEWLPTKLEKQIDRFRKSSDRVGLVYSWAEIIDDKGNLIMKFHSTKKGKVLREIFKGNFIPSSTVIVKKSCFDKVGLFDESFTSCQDREMWTRIASKYEVEVVPEYLARHHRHSGFSIGTSPKKSIYGYYQYFTKFQRLYLQQGMRKEVSQNLSWVAYELTKKGYKEECKECFRLSFDYDKTNWKNYVRFFLSLIIRKVRNF
jgi:glycosyltransferase involved in cell wall biosynthesis